MSGLKNVSDKKTVAGALKIFWNEMKPTFPHRPGMGVSTGWGEVGDCHYFNREV